MAVFSACVILNTLGAAVGWLCFLLVARLFRVDTQAGKRLEKLPIVILFAVWMCCSLDVLHCTGVTNISSLLKEVLP